MSRILNVTDRTNCHIARVSDNRDMATQENYLLDRIHSLQRKNGELEREIAKYKRIMAQISEIVFKPETI